MRTIIKYSLPVLLLLVSVAADAQKPTEPGTDNLYQEIRKADSLMFTAFNTRDVKKFEQMFTRDLEFFHDQSGLTSYDNTIGFLKRLADEKNDLSRTLLPETLEVYPIPGYGAMEIGQHKFSHTENGKTDAAIFKFVHVWKKSGDQWQVSRVISYGH